MAEKKSGTSNQPFLSDIETIRKRAREHIQCGAVTPSYASDRETVLRLLNEALATELVCVLRYKHHYYVADGLHAKAVADEFEEHANEEQQHADWLAVRIRQLGGNPDMNPSTLIARSHSEYGSGGDQASLVEMIEEDLIAERVAIESYREIIQYIGDRDSTTRRLMEKILAHEEEHAEDMASLLMNLDPTKGIVSPAA